MFEDFVLALQSTGLLRNVEGDSILINDHHRRAKSAIPKDYYPLPWREPIRDSDLVWNWCNSEWLRADSPEWNFPTSSIPREEIICVIRKTETEIITPTVRRYSIKREVQGSLF